MSCFSQTSIANNSAKIGPYVLKLIVVLMLILCSDVLSDYYKIIWIICFTSSDKKEYKLASTTQSADYRKKAISSAEDIVRYIEKGDAANAVRCMRRHLDLTKYAIINLNTE